MEIKPIQNYSYSSKTNFKHWDRTVYKVGTNIGRENVINRNNTYFFRDPIFWIDIVNFLEKKVKDIPRINIYSYGCSDGSDVYTLIMSLLGRKNKDLLKKCSPIIAKDLDPLAIKRAKSNAYYITKSEKEDINLCTQNKFDKFFLPLEKKSDVVPEANMQINPELTQYAQYSIANVLQDYKKINPNNSIIFLRNILPYIKENSNETFLKDREWKTQKKFLKDLYNHLGENSYIVIGGYDRYEMGNNLLKTLQEIGFIQTPILNLYKKGSNAEKTFHNNFLGKFTDFFQRIYSCF